MKAVILAGGLGTRISEETSLVPKPMVEIGGLPILFHIMCIYAQHGVQDFIVCAGFKQHIIKDYFYNFHRNHSDITYDLMTGNIEVHCSNSKPWSVTVIDTGLNTMTGGRLKRVRHLLGAESFFMTYGDGVADVDISTSLELHKKNGTLVTATAVKAPGRFGDFCMNGDRVTGFAEKSEGEKHRINGGFFVIDPKALDLIENDDTIWEQEPMRHLAKLGEISAFLHDGFWQPMDTLRDKRYLDDICKSGNIPWLSKERITQ